LTTTQRPFPALAEQRAEVRELLRQQAIAEAERRLKVLHRSIKCGENNHAPGGCQNPGDTCICECHDLAGEQ
jgi:hypothetical protein